MTRDATIYIENKTRWMLTRVVQALNKEPKLTSGEVGMNIDLLANQILQDWIAKGYPKLPEMWERRRKLDEESIV